MKRSVASFVGQESLEKFQTIRSYSIERSSSEGLLQPVNVQCNKVQFGKVQSRKIWSIMFAQLGLVRKGLVRKGLVLDGLVQKGLVREGLVWKGVIRKDPSGKVQSGVVQSGKVFHTFSTLSRSFFPPHLLIFCCSLCSTVGGCVFVGVLVNCCFVA